MTKETAHWIKCTWTHTWEWSAPLMLWRHRRAAPGFSLFSSFQSCD